MSGLTEFGGYAEFLGFSLSAGWDTYEGLTVTGSFTVPSLSGPSTTMSMGFNFGGDDGFNLESPTPYVGGGVPAGMSVYGLTGSLKANMTTGEAYVDLGVGVSELINAGAYFEGDVSFPSFSFPGWTGTNVTQVHGEGERQDQLIQEFSFIGSTWVNGVRVDVIHVSQIGPAGRSQWVYTVPNGHAELERLSAEASTVDPAAGPTDVGDQCFLGDTPIQMWPLEPSIKPRADGSYDEAFVLSKVWEKPISEIKVGDIVVAYDEKGRLAPKRVLRTMENTATHILDFWGTGVTPGHAYFCADGVNKGEYAPIIDILRLDGALMRANGTRYRAATNCDVGSLGDIMIHASARTKKPDGTWTEPKAGKVRFGTRIILPDGRHMSLMEIAASEGWRVSDDGYMLGMIKDGDGELQEQKFLFPYIHGEELPKPEAYIIARSAVTLKEIYAAEEWEQIGTRLPAPAGMVGLNTNHTSRLVPQSKPQPNIPPAFTNRPDNPTKFRGV